MDLNSILSYKKACCVHAYCRFSLILFVKLQCFNLFLLLVYFVCVCLCVIFYLVVVGRYVSWQFFSHLFCKPDKLMQCKWGAYDAHISSMLRAQFDGNFGTIFLFSINGSDIRLRSVCLFCSLSISHQKFIKLICQFQFGSYWIEMFQCRDTKMMR